MGGGSRCHLRPSSIREKGWGSGKGEGGGGGTVKRKGTGGNDGHITGCIEIIFQVFYFYFYFLFLRYYDEP